MQKHFFSLWDNDGYKNYWFNPSFGAAIYKNKGGNKYACIARTDNCPAYRIPNKVLISIEE